MADEIIPLIRTGDLRWTTGGLQGKMVDLDSGLVPKGKVETGLFQFFSRNADGTLCLFLCVIPGVWAKLLENTGKKILSLSLCLCYSPRTEGSPYQEGGSLSLYTEFAIHRIFLRFCH